MIRSLLVVPPKGSDLLAGWPPPRAWRAHWKELLPALDFHRDRDAPTEGETQWALGDPPTQPDGGGAVGPCATVYTQGEVALVLACDGQPTEGCDRATRRLAGETWKGIVAPSWRRWVWDRDSEDPEERRPKGWYLDCGRDEGTRHWWISPDSGGTPDQILPALADVDSQDPLADVHALAIVLAHVRGGRVEVTR